jgi:hypothetical protein
MSTAARFTGAKNADNTGRAAQRDYQKLAVTTTTNLAVIPNAEYTLFDLSVAVATPTINIGVGSSSTPPYVGDQVRLIITPDSTTRVITWGTGWIPTATTLSATGSKITIVTAIFNGTGWVITSSSTSA